VHHRNFIAGSYWQMRETAIDFIGTIMLYYLFDQYMNSLVFHQHKLIINYVFAACVVERFLLEKLHKFSIALTCACLADIPICCSTDLLADLCTKAFLNNEWIRPQQV